jgi:hypothetical protein
MSTPPPTHDDMKNAKEQADAVAGELTIGRRELGEEERAALPEDVKNCLVSLVDLHDLAGAVVYGLKAYAPGNKGKADDVALAFDEWLEGAVETLGTKLVKKLRLVSE